MGGYDYSGAYGYGAYYNAGAAAAGNGAAGGAGVSSTATGGAGAPVNPSALYGASSALKSKSWQPNNKHPLHKTVMCRFFEQGKCNRGEACSFAHAASELRSTGSSGATASPAASATASPAAATATAAAPGF
jgi:hypothetical protein